MHILHQTGIVIDIIVQEGEGGGGGKGKGDAGLVPPLGRMLQIGQQRQRRGEEELKCEGRELLGLKVYLRWTIERPKKSPEGFGLGSRRSGGVPRRRLRPE